MSLSRLPVLEGGGGDETNHDDKSPQRIAEKNCQTQSHLRSARVSCAGPRRHKEGQHIPTSPPWTRERELFHGSVHRTNTIWSDLPACAGKHAVYFYCFYFFPNPLFDKCLSLPAGSRDENDIDRKQASQSHQRVSEPPSPPVRDNNRRTGNHRQPQAPLRDTQPRGRQRTARARAACLHDP